MYSVEVITNEIFFIANNISNAFLWTVEDKKNHQINFGDKFDRNTDY